MTSDMHCEQTSHHHQFIYPLYFFRIIFANMWRSMLYKRNSIKRRKFILKTLKFYWCHGIGLLCDLRLTKRYHFVWTYLTGAMTRMASFPKQLAYEMCYLILRPSSNNCVSMNFGQYRPSHCWKYSTGSGNSLENVYFENIVQCEKSRLHFQLLWNNELALTFTHQFVYFE